MSWSTAFLAQLDSQAPWAPSWFVRTMDLLTSWGSDWTASTEPTRLGTVADIIQGSVQVTGPRLNIATWTSSGGGFSFVCRTPSEVLPFLTRGDVLILAVAKAGTAKSSYEDVSIGVVQQISYNGTGATRVECLDAMALLRSRSGTNGVNSQLFFNAGSTTALTSAFTGTTASVSTTANFERETGQPGAILVADPDGDYYASYTGTTGTSFTGCIKSRFGTTGTNTATGALVQRVAWLSGHPADIFRKLCASTGGGYNGDYDTLPLGWGLGIKDEFLDHDDTDGFATVADVSGGTQWDFVSNDPVANGLQWFLAGVKIGGFFPVIRQGRFSFRAANNLSASSSASVLTDVVITDDDLLAGASAVEYAAWSPQQPVEYGKVTVDNGFTFVFGSSEAIATLPAAETYRIGTDAYVFTNVANQHVNIESRLGPYLQRVSEIVRVRCRGLRLAQLALGDRPKLTTSRISGRNEKGSGGYNGRRGLVTAVDVDWGGNTVTVELHVPPAYTGTLP